MSTNLKNILVWLAVVVSLVLLWQVFYNVRDANIETKDFTTFYREMSEKKIKSVKIIGEDLEGEDANNKKFKTVVPADSGYDLAKELQEHGVSVTLEKSTNSSFMYIFLSSWLPFILLIVFWIFLMRQMQKRRETGAFFRKEPGAPHVKPAKEGYVQGRRRRRRGQGRAHRDHRIFKGTSEISEAGRQNSEGRSPDGPPGYWKDSPGAGHRWRS